MPVVKASEFQKHVGALSEIAERDPVIVTRHGRPSFVLLPAEYYRRLRQIEQRAMQAADVPPETAKAKRPAKRSRRRPG
jgi:prevent-host-death family protein